MAEEVDCTATSLWQIGNLYVGMTVWLRIGLLDAHAMKMRGIEAISKNVAQIAQALPSTDLHLVLDVALNLLREHNLQDEAIVDGVDCYFKEGQRRDGGLARKFAQMSEAADTRYTELQDAGAEYEVYDVDYRRAMAYFALGQLFDASELSHELLDDIIYYLAAGVENIDSFALQLEEGVRAKLRK